MNALYFRCNIRQPGCENVCFSAYSPFSFMRFSAFQIIVITIPTTVYVLYAAHTVSNNKQLNPTGAQAPILRVKMDRRQIQLQSEGLQKTIADKAKLGGGNGLEQRNRSARPTGRMESELRRDSRPASRPDSRPDSRLNSRINSRSNSRVSFLKGPSKLIVSKSLNTQVRKRSSQPPAYSNISFSSSKTQKISTLESSRLSSKIDFSDFENQNSADSAIYYNENVITTKNRDSSKKSSFQKRQTAYLKKHASAIDQITINAKSIKNSLSRAYVIHAIARFLIELVMCIVQLRSFPLNVAPLYKCNQWPCPNVVDCYPSRPREKSLVQKFLAIVSVFCVFVNFLDLYYLGYRKIRKCIVKKTNKLEKRGGKSNGQLVNVNDVLRMAKAQRVNEKIGRYIDGKNNTQMDKKNKLLMLQKEADKQYDVINKMDFSFEGQERDANVKSGMDFNNMTQKEKDDYKKC